MSENERIEELISAYSLGVLDGEDLKELEGYLEKNPSTFNKLLKENEEAFSELSYIVQKRSPSPGLKSRIVDNITAEEESITQKTRAPFWQSLQPIWFRFGSVAVLILIAVFIGYSVNLNNKLEELQVENVLLKESLSERDTELLALMEEIDSQTQALTFLEDPNVVIINLVNTEPNLKAVGRLLWNTADDEAIFYGLNLPQLPEGKTYQLWAIAGNVPKSAGIFQVDNKGNNVHIIKSLGDLGQISTFAVSIEPAGGVPTPTGEVYLAGDT